MKEMTHIVALEIGSTKIQAIAAKRDQQERLSVLAYFTEDATEFVKNGNVINIDMAAKAAGGICKKLEERIGSPIERAYLTFSGQGIHSEANRAFAGIGDQEKITQETVDQLLDSNRGNSSKERFIFDMEPQEYQVDNLLVRDPVGARGESITANFLNIVGRESIRTNLEMAMQEAGITIADMYLIPKMSAKSILTRDEMRSGCVLVDLGGGTTTVSIFKDNLLRYMSVLPIGQMNITRDLTSLKMEPMKAEELKKDQLDAISLSSSEPINPEDRIAIDASHSVSMLEFQRTGCARLNEIIRNVLRQINSSAVKDQLLSGLILTGGGCDLRNIDHAFRQILGSLSVRKAQAGLINMSSEVDLPDIHHISALLGVAMVASEDCFATKSEEAKKPEETPDKTTKPQASVSRRQAGKRGLGNLFGSLFGNEEDGLFDGQEEEEEDEEKRIRREEERRKAEEDRRKAKEEQAQRKKEALARKRQEQEERRKARSNDPNSLNIFVKDLFADNNDDEMM